MVIDTDGSAFITKAEFDSLKNNFQAQIDNYNSSIDSKIDGAIASYLAGIKLATIRTSTINLNPYGESILFMSTGTSATYKNFYGCVGIDSHSIAISSAAFSTGYLRGGQSWVSEITPRTFNYAITRMKDNSIKLLKNIKLLWRLVCYNSSYYFADPTDPSGGKLNLFCDTSSNWSNYLSDLNNGGQNTFRWVRDYGGLWPTMYCCPAYLNNSSSGGKRWDYSNYYAQFYPFSNDNLPRDIEWQSYTDDNIRVLFSGQTAWNHIVCFADPSVVNFKGGRLLYFQKNSSPYRLLDQSARMYIKAAALSKDVSYYTGESYACTTWATYDEATETANALSCYSMLPPCEQLAYNAECDLKNFNGTNIKINDGYPFFTNTDKAGTLDFELQSVTSLGSGWKIFVTDEPMALSNYNTTKTKINIKKQGDAAYVQEITWSDTNPLKINIEVEKDKTYYIYVMNSSTGLSPIFKFAPTGTQTIVEES